MCGKTGALELFDSEIKCIVPVSGGKDSQACVKLAVAEFGADAVQGLFCDTKFEHSLTYAHVERISEIYGIKIHAVCAGSVEVQIRKHRRFPGGGSRFCTEELKIWPAKRFYNDFAMGNGPFEVWYGMRSAESTDRKTRYAGKIDGDLYPPHEVMAKYPKRLEKLGCMFRLPIINWSKADVLDYLDGEENPLYKLGFERVGCFPCLASGDQHKEKAFKHDDFGRSQLAKIRALEPMVGRSVFTSKGGKLRNDGDQGDGSGCAFCAI
jgi:3'-phosphoadenosine 5'-phosphosulfate sulfotransferase (PAPS reductase)/FAD synthetase